MREDVLLSCLLGIAFSTAGCVSAPKTKPPVVEGRFVPDKLQPALESIRAVPPEEANKSPAPVDGRTDDAGARPSSEVVFVPPDVGARPPPPGPSPKMEPAALVVSRSSDADGGGPVFAPETFALVPVVEEGAEEPEVPLPSVEPAKALETGTVETQQFIELECPDCSGKGRVACAVCGGQDLTQKTCLVCKGQDLTQKTCLVCKGQDLTQKTCLVCKGQDLTQKTCLVCKGQDLTQRTCLVCRGQDLTQKTCLVCRGIGSCDGKRCYSCHGSGKQSRCYSCHGSGKQSRCYSCHGSGKQSRCYSCHGAGTQSRCYSCHGSGKQSRCYSCHGAGKQSPCYACHGSGGVATCSACAGNRFQLISIVEGSRANLPSPRVAGDWSFFGEPNEKGVPKTVFVQGYVKADGTVVRSHYRAPPGFRPTLSYDRTTRTLAGLGVRAPPQVKAGSGVAENGSYYGEISTDTGRPKTVHVRGYFRKDGTYVRSHYRSSPRRR